MLWADHPPRVPRPTWSVGCLSCVTSLSAITATDLSLSLTLQRNLGKSKTVLPFLPRLTRGHMKRPSAPRRATPRGRAFSKRASTSRKRPGEGRRWFISENVKCAHPAASNGLFAHSQRRREGDGESRGRCPLFSSLNQFVS